MDEKLLTLIEVASYLQVSRQQAWRLTTVKWAKGEPMPVLKYNRELRFRKSDLDAWLERRSSREIVQGIGKARAYWHDAKGNPGWYAQWFDSTGAVVGDSEKVNSPVDLSAIKRNRPEVIQAMLEYAFPGAQIEVIQNG